MLRYEVTDRERIVRIEVKLLSEIAIFMDFLWELYMYFLI